MMIVKALLDLIYPRLCYGCEEALLLEEEHVCLACEFHLPKTGFHRIPGNDVFLLLRPHFPVTFAGSMLYFKKGTVVQQLLHEIKYRGNKKLGNWLAIQMANDFFKYLSGNENEIDLVLPVPIHRKKKRKRGYNQAELIAKGIVGQLGVDMVTDVLVSQKGKRSQTGIGRYGRWLNVGSVFGLRYEHKLKGKHVLVVDDVVTTGATLLRCIDLLKEIEGIRISVYTLAFADRL